MQPKRQVADYVKFIRSFRAYHNIFVIEKGDNTEPSNFDYSLENVHAARALRTILDELERSPTAAGYGNLVELYRVAGKLPDAWAVANEALAKWPEHSGLLIAAFSLATQAGDTERKLDFVRRLAALDSGDAALQSLVRETEAEIARAAPRP